MVCIVIIVLSYEFDIDSRTRSMKNRETFQANEVHG
jgi:hypothetical protein